MTQYDDKANISNNNFTEQSSLNDSNANLAVDLDLPDFTLNYISVTAKLSKRLYTNMCLSSTVFLLPIATICFISGESTSNQRRH